MLRIAGICRRVSSSVAFPVTKTVARLAMVLAVIAGPCGSASAQTAAQFASSFRYISSTWNMPSALATDASGNLFVTSIGDNTIREVFAATHYTTSAQIAVANGHFNGPYGIAVDANANLFVTDSLHHVVKEILAAGGYVTVNTLASSGLNTPLGIGVNATGDVYVGEGYGSVPIFVISAASGYSTISPAPLPIPSGLIPRAGGITFDSVGNMFFTDVENSRVYESPVATGYTTLTQIGVHGDFSRSRQIATDTAGNVYVADDGNAMLKEIVAAGGYTTVKTLYTDTNVDYGVALNAKGDIFFTDITHNIYEIEKSGVEFGLVNVGTTKNRTLTFTVTAAGDIDTAPSVLTNGATGGAFTDAGTGTCTTNGTSHHYLAGDTCTVDVTFSPQYPGITHGAVTLTNGGAPIATVLLDATGTGPLAAYTLPAVAGFQSGLNRPRDIVFDGAGNFYVADNADPAVYKYPAGGGSRVAISSGWGDPTGLALDGAGNLYVADFYNGLFKVTPAGVKTAIGVIHQVQPSGVAVDGSGNVYWVNGAGDRNLYKLSPDGTETKLGDFYNSAGQIAVDASGNIYVAQGLNVWKVPPTGTVGNGTLVFHEPIGAFAASVDVDPAGNIYVSENDHNIYEVPADGSAAYITLDTGYTTTGIRWYNGDLYVTDGTYRQIRRLSRSSNPAITFPSTPVNGTSGPKVVAIENDGNTDLHLTVPASGVNPTVSNGFTLNSSCPQVAAGGTAYAVAPGHTCTDTIGFAPTDPNTGYLGAIVHTSDSGNVSTDSIIHLSGSSTGSLTTTTLGIAPSSTVVVGSGGVTLTASVSPTNANGTVTFYDGASAVSTAIAPTAGVASFAYTNPAAGSHSLTAVFTGGSGFNSSTSSVQTLAVNQLSQSIVFAQPPAQVGGSTYTLTATASSGLPVTYTVISGPATISGSVVTYTGHGTVVISANQAGTATYAPATTVTYSVVISAPAVAYAYGAANVGSIGSTQTAYVTFATGGTLDAITAYNQRAAVSDFQVVSGGTCAIGKTYTAGQDCSIKYTFAPSAVGTRLGGLVLATNASQQLAISYISGVGLAPIFTFVNPTGSVFATGTTQPSSMSIDADGILYIGSGTTNSLSEFTSTGLGIANTFPMPPAGVAVDGASNFAYVQGNQIIKSSPSNVTLMTYPTNGYAVTPAGIAFGADGTLYAADPTHHSIVYFALDGTAFALNTGGASFTASSVAIDAANNVYIPDQANNRVLKVPAYGGTATVVSITGAVPTSVQSIAIDPAGDLYIGQSAGPVLRVTPDGVAVALSLDGLTPAYANDAAGIAVDGRGRVFVASASTGAVYMFDPNSTAQLTFPKTVVGTSSVQTVEPVLNGGTTNLVFGGMTPSTDWNFSGAGTTCATVAPGATCGLGIVFAPTVTGTLIETVSVSDNSLNTTASQTISVTGEGLNNPSLQLSPTSINFPSTTVNTATPTYSVNFSNMSGVPTKFKLPYVAITGPDAAQFSQTNNCPVDLPAYSSCQIVITFKPLVAGNFNATLTLTDYTVSYVQTTTLTGTGVNVTTLLAPSSLAFSDQTVGSSSASQSIIFSNTSVGVVNITNITVTGADAANFTQTNNCPATLQPNTNCAISVVFKPGAAGSFSNAAIQITDDVPGSPQVAPLSGNGIAPVLTLSASTLNFGSVAQGTSSASQTVNFSNTSSVPVTIVGITPGGGDSAQFSFDRSDCSVTLAAFSTCKIVVTFSPTASGNFNGSLSVAYSSNGIPQATQTVALTGTGLAPTIAISATSLAFSNQEVGTNSSTQVVTLSNNGGGPVTIGTISIAGAGFADTTNCGTVLAQGANCTISVTFSPTAPNSYAGTLTIPDNAAGGPHSVVLSGTSALPVITVSQSNIDFGSLTVGTTSNAQTITVNNQSNGTVPIPSITIVGAGFALNNGCGTQIGAHSTCTVTVAFAPATAIAYSASLVVVDGGAGSPHTVALTGTGTAVTAQLAPNGLNFPNMTVGGPNTTQTLALQNTSQGKLLISSIGFATSPSAFTISNNCGASLAANATCLITVGYAPSAAGSFSSTVVVTTSNGGAPLTAGVTANASLPAVQLSASNIDFGTQAKGSSSTPYNLNFSNMSNVAVAITNAQITGSTAFVLSNSCGTSVLPNMTCNLQVTFTPADTIAYTGSLTVTSTRGTQTIALTGTGIVAPDYSLVASNPNLSLLAGQTGVVSFKLTPSGGYKGSVTLSLSNLGSGITASFVPATLVADGSNSVQTSVLTIHTDGPNTGTVSQLRGQSTKTALASMMFLPALLLGGLLLWRRRKLSVSGQRLLTLLILASFVSGLAGCASPLTLTSGTQTVTVTAVSQATGTGGAAAITHTAVFTLTVKTQ